MTTYGDPSLFLFVNPDFTPPSPNPMTWDVEPYQSGPGEITMVATAAVDPEGANVEYYFQNVFGGGKDSGWQSSRTYVDTQVTQLYNSYRVKARDTGDNLNQTAYSMEAFGIIEQYPYSGQIRTIPDKIVAEHFDGGGSGISGTIPRPAIRAAHFVPEKMSILSRLPTDSSVMRLTTLKTANGWRIRSTVPPLKRRRMCGLLRPRRTAVFWCGWTMF
jgi:hypothetical protein